MFFTLWTRSICCIQVIIRIVMDPLFFMSRALGLAWRNLVASRWRTMLSLSTILLGSIAVVATFTINQNVDSYIEKLTEKNGGPTLRMILPARKDMEFNQQDIDLISTTDSVVRVAPILTTENIVFRWDENTFNPTVTGVTASSLDIEPLVVDTGSGFGPLDFADLKPNIVVSPETVKNLKIDDPIGKTIIGKLSSREILFRIIGVGKSVGGQFDFDRGSIWMTSDLYRDLMGQRGMNRLAVRLESFDNMDVMEKALVSIFQRKFGRTLRVLNPRNDLERAKAQMKSLVYAGMALGVLALFSGSVGIMNVMLVGIKLRRREIGLYRALGFSSGIIRLQFFIEACLISLLGGFVGAFVGSFLGVILSKSLVKPYQEYSWTAVGLGIIVTFVIGGIFGIIPALRAARLNPVEALRG